jgi:type IV/VI secretion system ImpK/VasF family protein
MADAPDQFSEVFGYVLLFEQTNQQGEFQPAYEQVRRDITALLEQEKAAARRRGILDRDYQDACFAVVAWADETILKHSTWKHHHEWNAFPLQLEYFQTRNAGEEFFERLERLRAEQKPIREVYYLCLGLGFSGRYFLGLEDELKLNQIRHEQAKSLALPIEDVEEVDKLTPQPYEVPTLATGQIKPPWTDLLLKAGLPLLILIPIVLALIYWFWLAPAPAPGVPLAEKVKQWLDSHPEVLQCAKVVPMDVQAGVISLGGRVASESQGAEIRKGVQSVERGVQVKDTFQTIPQPLCAVLDLLEPIKKFSEDQAAGVIMSLNKQGRDPLYGNPVYVEGEKPIITVKTPTKFPSFVYVDYFMADGGVYHLFPDPKGPIRSFPPTQSLAVGDSADAGRSWVIQEPFGLELVTVIASKDKLFDPPRPDQEPAATYISALRQTLPQNLSNAQIAATFYLITSRAK